MTKYTYATLHAEDVIGITKMPLPPDSFLAADTASIAYRNLIGQGYRWVRTDNGFAIFERQEQDRGENTKLRSKYAIAFESLTSIAANPAHAQQVAADAAQRCIEVD